MRRVVAIFLLALFSLQSAWAVAAAYCEHESQQGAAHFGHHADAVPADNGGDDGGASAGSHCHDCHAGCAYPAPPVVHTQPRLAGAAPLQALGVKLPAPPASLPERPNWPAFA